MKFRRWLLVLLAVLICLPSVVPGAQANSAAIRIFLNGQKLDSDISPYILSKVNVTMVPVRIVSEGLGASVTWSQSSRKATITQNGSSVELTYGKPYALVNGSTVKLDATVQIKQGRVMVPIRFVSENLGVKVEWNQAAKEVRLTTKGWAVPENPGLPPVIDSGDEVRGAWITTHFNLDWPAKNSSALKQQADFSVMLDKLKAAGINHVYVQVRPAGDALYRSDLVPWSSVLTGIQGMDPGYDPLAFMIEEAHERGMKFHAWFNPFRAHTKLDRTGLAPEHAAAAHPEWILEAGTSLMLNPGIPEARQHIIDTVMEVVNGYEVDGIHLDDYFYPSNTSLKDSAAYSQYNGSGYKSIGDWRRGNINAFVKELGESIKTAKPYVEYGISPSGVWRNKSADSTGSDTKAGVTAYDSMYADVRTWIRNGWIDYAAPQIYWSMNFAAADYDKLVDWWVEEVRGTGVKLLIGHAAYKVGDTKEEKSWQKASEIISQLKYNERYAEIGGSIFFRAQHLLSNPLGLLDQLKLYYQL